MLKKIGLTLKPNLKSRGKSSTLILIPTKLITIIRIIINFTSILLKIHFYSILCLTILIQDFALTYHSSQKSAQYALAMLAQYALVMQLIEIQLCQPNMLQLCQLNNALIMLLSSYVSLICSSYVAYRNFALTMQLVGFLSIYG